MFHDMFWFVTCLVERPHTRRGASRAAIVRDETVERIPQQQDGASAQRVGVFRLMGLHHQHGAIGDGGERRVHNVTRRAPVGVDSARV